MSTSPRIEISERTIFRRLKRHYHRKEHLFLHAYPAGGQWFNDLGRYYTVDHQHHIAQTFIDLEREARECGVLRSNEIVSVPD